MTENHRSEYGAGLLFDLEAELLRVERNCTVDVLDLISLTVIDAMWPQAAFDLQVRARLSLALVFMFTASGHFAKSRAMSDMLPPWVPGRLQIVYATGVLEIAGAVGLLIPQVQRVAGMCLIAFLVTVFPANDNAARKRVDIGGHAEGPAYLLARAPLQWLLVVWTYWFAVR